MGCDIHCYVEHGLHGRFWAFLSEFNPGRNYSMFSLMAGVRQYDDKVAPLFTPRGLPENAQWHVKESFKKWGSDAHTPSWLTTEEFKRVMDRYAELYPNEPARRYVAILALMKELGEARIIFWFDN